MHTKRTIKNVLISVFHKENLEPVIRQLEKINAQIYTTGGTQTFIEQLGVSTHAVEKLTGFPSILGGRVKTLHPAIFGGILARQDVEDDNETLQKNKFPKFDLVVVDLYPFQETVRSHSSHEDIIEKIDIGGISLIRAAAKNYHDVLIISNRSQYKELLYILEKQEASTNIQTRKKFSKEAFHISSQYDQAIANYLSDDNSSDLFNYSENSEPVYTLRYGENPHQKGRFIGTLDHVFEKLYGKEISYNNLLDIDAALGLIQEFKDPTIAILKHNNACGAASDIDLCAAWEKALAGDPVSAFGGVIVCNDTITYKVAQNMHKLFFEVLIAPHFENEAFEMLSQKPNRILLRLNSFEFPSVTYRTLLNGVIEQNRDNVCEQAENMTCVTEKCPSNTQLSDLEFALKIAKHSKSNTIVLAKNKQLIASGVGMTSRVDALKHALNKAAEFQLSTQGAVMASDAFFPFPDCVAIAHEAGISAVVQPGGSIKDNLSIDYCNENKVAMVLTGVRHFKH